MLADDDLIEYYKRELAYLRHQGADFSVRMNASGMLNTCKSYGGEILSGERVSNA